MRACNAFGEPVDLQEIKRQKEEEFWVVCDASKKVGGTCGPTKSTHPSKTEADKEAKKNKNYLVLQAKHKMDLGLHFNPLIDSFKSHSANYDREFQIEVRQPASRVPI
jgi:hypothetical protein